MLVAYTRAHSGAVVTRLSEALNTASPFITHKMTQTPVSASAYARWDKDCRKFVDEGGTKATLVMNAGTPWRRFEAFLEVSQAISELWFPLNPTRTSMHFALWIMLTFEVYSFLYKGTYQTLHRRRVEFKRSAEHLQEATGA